MPLQFPRLPRSLLYPRPIIFDGFRGVNLTDDPTQLGEGFSPWCVDLVFDSQGRMRKRPNWSPTAPLGGWSFPTGIAAPKAIYYWPSKDYIVYQDGAALKYWKYSTGGATSGTAHTFSTSATCAMVEFNGNLVAVHPVDGVSDYDGTTWTLRNATVKGSSIAAWQNKLWVGGDTSNRSRVWASNAGSSATWTTATDFVDLREVNDNIVTAIGGGNGMDIAGRPGLMVFKASSWYRINSSNATTGFTYTTLHDKAGAVGPNAIASDQSHLASIGVDAVYMSDGVNAPVRVSRLVDPFFSRGWDSEILPMSDVSATVRNNIFVFSRGTHNAGNYCATYDPLLDVWGLESKVFDGATIYSSTDGAQAPLVFDISTGNIVQAVTHIADTAATFNDSVCEWLSPIIEPFTSRNSRLQTVQIRGNWTSASVKFQTLKDQLATTTDYTLPAKPVDTTHESYTHTLRDLGFANLWQMAIRETVVTSGTSFWADAFAGRGTNQLGFTTMPPFQIARIAATFYLMGQSS